MKHETQMTGPLSSQELHNAQGRWIKISQTLEFETEITNLRSGSQTRLPVVRQLRLFLDDEGFFRCGGRMHNADLSEVTRFPFLLPQKHPLTALIVHDTHMKQLFFGVNATCTVTALRQTFWITYIPHYVRKLLWSCVTCKKLEGVAFKAPDPAPLPKLRVQESAPFYIDWR